ncbi:MAG: hypothetical protein E6293_02160 [Dialister sp.]|nr:hypothetical protein [Dialister sp.]
MNDKKENILLFVFVISFLISVWFLCAGRSTVHDLRERAGNTGKQLETVIEKQREERKVIDRTERAVEHSERLNREIERVERTDRELIRENQEILRRIRARGGKEN